MSVDVDVLIHDHKKAVSTVDGIEFHSVPSLLSQLREAVFGGMESTGGSAFGSKMPISAAALDLYQRLDRQITEAWVAAFKRVPGRDAPEALLAEWAAWADEETLTSINGRDVYARDVVARWVNMVEDFFNPPRLAEISLPCPSCDARHVNDDGEETRSCALNFRRDRDTGETLDARCLACGAVWMPFQFMFFLRALNAAYTNRNTQPPEQESR